MTSKEITEYHQESWIILPYSKFCPGNQSYKSERAEKEFGW